MQINTDNYMHINIKNPYPLYRPSAVLPARGIPLIKNMMTQVKIGERRAVHWAPVRVVAARKNMPHQYNISPR